MKTLIISEKPSVARDIGRVLKCNKKAEGYIFNEKYIISWAIGHLVSLFEPEDYNENLKKWNISDLPIIPQEIKLKPIKSTYSQLKILKTLMNSKEVDKIICATDSGREGELIFRYIYEINKCNKTFYRLWISSLTDESIKEGFQNLKEGKEYDNLYYSAKCRSEADWLVGINSSRIFTLKFGELLSIGRVQTPTLAILVKREKEIKAFVEEKYFEVEVNFESSNKVKEYKAVYINEKNKSKINKEQDAKDIIQKIKNKVGKIKDIVIENKKQLPPLLYDLTELQRDSNKKYGYSAQKTLSIAQELYEKRKLITYPRTDSRYLSKDLEKSLKPLLQTIKKIDIYSEFCEEVLSKDFLKITKRIIEDSKVTDHHAIIPTNSISNFNNLSKDEFNVYDLIVRRFICVFYPDYTYQVSKVFTNIEEYTFLTQGNIITQKGWTALNIIIKKDKDNIILPNLEVGMKVVPKNINMLNKKTKPPKQYTEATLLSAMENAGRFVEDKEIQEKLKESGLGTPATRASIIERLIKIGYVTRKGKNLIPTQKGIKLIDIVPDELKSPETTGKWEKALISISKGKMDSQTFMKSIFNYIYYIVDYAKNHIENTNNKLNLLGKCPNCSGSIYENSKSFYCSEWQKGCKFSIWKDSILSWGLKVDNVFIKKILKHKVVENVNLINPNNNTRVIANIHIANEKIGGLIIKKVE